jgi:hypothetical protein
VVKFLKIFWALLGSLAGIAALYIGAVSIHALWAFVLIVAVVAVVSGVWVLLPKLGELVMRIRNYPTLLNQVGTLIEERDSLHRQVANYQGRQRLANILEGREQVIGQMAAAVVGPLTLTGITRKSEQLLLVARLQDETRYKNIETLPLSKARYHVEIAATGEIKGVAVVVAYDEVRQALLLECVDERVPDFWGRLTDMAVTDPAPPNGVILQPYKMEAINLHGPHGHPLMEASD